MRLIICFTHTSRFYPAKQGEFVWSEKHQCHVWQGAELTPEEFNKVAAGVLQSDEHYIRPTVRVIDASSGQKTISLPVSRAAFTNNNFETSDDSNLEKQLSELTRSLSLS